jgi:DNA-binding response OmpR family regulator
MARVLLVDDEPTLVATISYNLRSQGYTVDTAADGLAALRAIADQRPDVVVLDVMLPGIDGFEVCRRARRTSAVPILMLSARGEEMDKVVGLEVGADDYLAKPFSMRELLARVRALLRRREMLQQEVDERSDGPDDILTAGDIRIDVPRHAATRAGEPVNLTAKEFALLEALVRNRGRVLSPGRLLEIVWGYSDTDTRTVAVHIRTLRQRIEDDPSSPTHIETIRGVGYRYSAS